MLIIVAGMPKSGSAWYYNLTNDLLVASGYKDSRQTRDKYGLQDMLKFNVCNIQELTAEKLQYLTTPPLAHETFAVKTHFAPNEHVEKLMRRGLVKVTYIFRDLRGVALSGFEEGQKLCTQGRFHRTISGLTNLEEAITWSERHIHTWRKWSSLKGALLMRYEDLNTNPSDELKRLRSYLEIEVSDSAIMAIIEKWKTWKLERQKEPRQKEVLHFNEGITGRFRTVMTSEQLELCRQVLGKYLEEMGYTV